MDATEETQLTVAATLVSTLKELTEAVKDLKDEVKSQKTELQELKSLAKSNAKKRMLTQSTTPFGPVQS